MPVRLCLTSRCANPAVYRGRCTECNRANERRTHARKHFYNSKRWKATRELVLHQQPLCAIPGCDMIAVDVDHITAIEAGGDPWARHNLQGLCRPHHSEKTRQEMTTR